MKKTICLIITIVMIALLLASCSSTVVPVSTPTWNSGETITYQVRKASDYELTLVNISPSYLNVLPSTVDGTYTTNIVLEGDNYVLTTTLDVEEVYPTNLFEDDSALLQKAINTATNSDQDALSYDDTNFFVHTQVQSVVTFNKTSFLPISSAKTVKSALFVKASIVNGKTYQGDCQVNDFTVETTYDYSAKTPKATVTSSFAEQSQTVKLAKTSNAKTYDNEQLAFLLRSFSIDTLSSNLQTPLTVFDAVQATSLSLSTTVNQNPSFDYQIYGTMNGTDEDGNTTYYQTEDKTQYTDVNNNVVQTIQRKVAQVYLTTGGKPIYYYFDHEDSDLPTAKKTLIRMQQDYMIFDVTTDSLNAI